MLMLLRIYNCVKECRALIYAALDCFRSYKISDDFSFYEEALCRLDSAISECSLAVSKFNCIFKEVDPKDYEKDI